MYLVTDNNGMIMNWKKLGSSQKRVSTKSHTGLIAVKKFDGWRKGRKEGHRSSMAKKIKEICLEIEKQRDEIKEETVTGNTGCPICGKEFRRKDSLKFHVINHNRDKYQCIGCKVGFKKEKEREDHELECKRNESMSQLECSFCGFPCDSPTELRTHENKHRSMKKSKNYKSTCVCIDCKEVFDSTLSLKVHMKRDHEGCVKSCDKSEMADNKKEMLVSDKDEGAASDSPVGDVSNRTQLEKKDMHDQLKNSHLSVQVPQIPDIKNQFEDKPFTCWKCGSRYKYEKSKIKHELKYHASGELSQSKPSQDFGEVDTSQQIKTSQVPSEGGSPGPHVVGSGEGEATAKVTVEGNIIDSDNSDIIPVENIKKENGYSLPVACSVPVEGNDTGRKTDGDKRHSSCSHPIRQPIIKKKCIGCDKAFEGIKERDEHELKCGLNSFNRRFNCMFCDHPFGKPKALRKHENKHRPVRKTKKYKNRCVCIECNKTFDAIYSLRVHMKKLHRKGNALQFKNKPFGCSMCESRFKYENSKYKHEMRYHSADLHQKVEYRKEENLDTNFNANVISNSNGVAVVSKEEKNDRGITDIDNHRIKEEPDMCSEFGLDDLFENKVYSPVCDVKTEAASPDETPLAGAVEIKTEEVDKALMSSSQGDGRKRKGRKPVERKTKKQKTGPYVCNNCEAKFNSPQGLWLHSYHQNMRTKRLSCIGCGRSFKSEKATEEHELKCDFNHNEYEFNCTFCDEPFGTPKLLRNHELEHKPLRKTKNYKCVCIICRKPFDSIHSLKEHIRSCHKMNHGKINNDSREESTPHMKHKTPTVEEMMSCYVLLKDIREGETKKGAGKPKFSKSKYEGNENFDRVSDSSQDQTKADIDGYTGNFTLCDADVHIKDETECNAPVCDISGGDVEPKMQDTKPRISDDLIETPVYLVETELSHPEMIGDLGTTLFECGKCSAKFDSYGKLRYHSYSHRQRTKRLFCIGCGLGFEQNNDRDRHELECNVNVTNRQFSCIFCELPFDTPQSLRKHENKHRPPKRYKRYKHMCLCAECDRAFDAVFTLKIHIRHMHRGSKGKVKIEKEVDEADVNFQSDLTFEEYKLDGDLKLERV